MSRKLYKSLKAQKAQTEQVKLTIYGSLGIPLGGRKIIQVDGRQGYVYVRLRDNQNEVIQAFNNKVAASYDLPVILVREGGRYVVQQFNSQRYLNNAQNSAPFLPGHGTQHSFPRGGGADITWVYGQQIMPGLVYPESATGTNVMIEKYPLYSSNGWIYAGGTGTQNILQYRPTTGSSSLMTLVYLDSLTGNPGILVGSGTYFPAVITGSVYPYLPSPSNTQIPLAGVLLNTGTSVITWENLYDVRQWVHASPSGTSSGGGGGGVDTIGFAGLSNGVPIGTGTFLNVQGATFTRSGTMFNLNIPSSPAPQMGVYVLTSGTPLGTGTTFNFVGGTYASITGTTVYVNTRATAETNANDIFSVSSPGGVSLWAGTISGAPAGASVTVSAPTSGTEGVLVPISTSQLAKMRVYNLTRGNSALISNYNTGTNVITLTANAPVNWANGDSLTVVSQTVSGGGFNWIDLEITSGPTSKINLFMFLTIVPGAAGDTIRTHPLETFSASKVQTVTGQVATVPCNGFQLVKITSNVFSIAWGTTPTTIIMREVGYLS